MFEWKWFLIGSREFIDQFWQNNLGQKLRHGMQNKSQPLLNLPAHTYFVIWNPENCLNVRKILDSKTTTTSTTTTKNCVKM